jgi:hypothetical protein
MAGFPVMALLNSRALKRDARPPMKSQNLAAKDIVRRNHLGQNVLVVPKGQPIPADLKVTDEERGAKKQTEKLENKAHTSDRPTPKAASSKG